MKSLKSSCLFRILAAVVAFASCGVTAIAATQNCYYTVTSTADSGPGTLRAGLANGNAPTICFSLPNNSTITLASTLQITNPVTITNNPTTSALTISGNQQVQVLSVNLPNSQSVASITGLTITGGVGVSNGNQATVGGGIWNQTGTLTLTNVTITGNSASYGAGILNSDTLFLNTCGITNNTASSVGFGLSGGGGLANQGTATIFDGAITGNTTTGGGGGIYNASQAQLTISGAALILSNTANDGGGGIENQPYATATISSTSIESNSTQAPSGSTYTTNGGGIENQSATMTITQSTVAYNNADGNGAGISNGGTLNLDESTVATNIGEGIGGGIYSTTGLTLTSNTISDNIGYTGWSGLYDVANGMGDGSAVNNIIAGNGSNGDCAGCSWIPTTYNFIGGSPRLNNLAVNGGQTPTMMPFPGSPVIAAGNPSVNPDRTDQRGLSRVSASGIDFGAVQTHYNSVVFSTQPAGTVVNQPMATVAAQVLEVDGNTVNYPQGVAVYLSLLDANGNPSTATLGNNFPEQPMIRGGVTTAQFPALTVNAAGTYELQATTYYQEPGGQTDPRFNTVSSTFSITAPNTPITVNWAPPSYVYGPLPAGELNATATQNGVAVSGSFAYTFTATGATVTAGQVYTAGSYAVTVVFTDAASGQTASKRATLVVTKATPSVALVTPPAIVPGLALNTAVLHATATGVAGVQLPGTFTYSKALGTVLGAGSQTVSATFAPTDSTDYTGGSSASATFTVLGPTASATSLSVTPNSGTAGTADTLLAQVLPSGKVPGVVNGTVNFDAGSSALSSHGLALVPSTAHISLGAAAIYSSFAEPAAYNADVNGDGVADQILSNGSEIKILFADPSNAGSYYVTQTLLATYSSCSYISGLDVGDVNGDGLPDIVAACQNYSAQGNTGPLLLYVNQGNGKFAAPVSIAGMPGAQVALADFDGDGIVDLVSLGASCPSGVASCISFQHGRGDGTFNAANYSVLNGASTSDTFDSLQTADFNGDGKADLTFIYRPGGSGGQVSVFINNATSAGVTFGTVVPSGSCGAAHCYTASATVSASVSGNTPLFLVADDVNGDGIPDLAAVMTDNSTGSGNTLSVALNSASAGTVHFPAHTTDTVYAGAQSLALADFNRDGIADVAVYSQTTNVVQVLLGSGNGTFSTVLTSTTLPALAYQLPVFSVGDANGDGFPDLMLAEPSYYTVSGVLGILSGTAKSSLASTAPVATTSYSATAVPASALWAGSSGSATFTVTSQPTQTGLTVTPVNSTYGTLLTAVATVIDPASGAPVQGGTVTFVATGNTLGTVSVVNGSATLSNILFAILGKHNVQALYSGTTGQAASSSSLVLILITKATPSITWATPSPITSSTPLSTTQLNAVVGSSGAFPAPAGTTVYTPAAGTTLSVGTHTLSVTFTPTNTTDYNTATATVSILVTNTNTQTSLTVTPLTSGAPVYGTPLTLSAQVTLSTTGGPATGGSVTFTQDGAVLSIVKLTGTGGAALSGVLPTAGQHKFGASYSGTSGEAPSVASTSTVQVAKFTPVVHWSNPAAITTQTPLGGMQLNAVAAGLPSATLALPGSFVYAPPAGTFLSAGSHTLVATFTPTDTVDYNAATGTAQILVNLAGTVTTLSASPLQSTYGQALTLTAHVTNTVGSVVVNGGTITFSGSGSALSTVAVTNGVAVLSGVVLPAGTPAIGAVYTPSANESASSASGTVAIGKAAPVLSWAPPAAISSTTPLSAAQLNATATGVTGAMLPGTFAYTPAAGTLSVGTHTLSVTFTPTDLVDYTTATVQVSISVVSTNTQTAFALTPAQPVYGQALVLTAQVTNTGSTTAIQSGSVVFAADNVAVGTVAVVNGAASLGGISLTGGMHLLTASYTGAPGEGASAAAARTIVVAKAGPVVSWAPPAQITTTTALSGTQLNATAARVNGAVLPGTFAYTPAAGTLLPAGTQTLSVTFTPTDAVDYSTATAQVSISVAAQTITLTSISPSTTTLGTTPLPVTLTGSGFASTAVVRLGGTPLPTTVVSATQLRVTVPALSLENAGVLSFTVYDTASQAVSNALTLSVTAPTATAVVTTPAGVVSGDQPSVAITLANTYPVDIAGTYTLGFVPAGPDGVDDPNVEFSNGQRTIGFTIPAGQNAPTSPETFQAGTVEGTISISTVLTAGGVDVTPAALTTPIAIGIAPAVPVITGVTVVNGAGVVLSGSGGVNLVDAKGLLTVVVTGYSNTREMVEGEFTFSGPGVGDLASPSVIVPATGLFGSWYTSTGSGLYGSTFSYTQTFQLSNPATLITGASVTLTNTVGTSQSVSTQ